MICIYAIVNIANDNFYIGQTKDKDFRWREHKKQLNGFYHHSLYLQRAWCKHGAENFIFIVLEKLTNEALLNEREGYWFKLLKPEYNVAPAGSMRGYKHTEEAKKNMSDAHKGRKQSEETKAKRATSMRGNQNAAGVKQSQEHIEARAKVIRGKPKSAEQKAKIAAGNKGKHRSIETRNRQSEAALKRDRNYSEETRRKLSEAAKKRWDKLDEIKNLWS